VRYFPVFLDLKGKLCVVVGGGRVAERKVRSLLKAGASVKVISPQVSKSLHQSELKGKITRQARSFRSNDLRGAFLAIAATDDRATNERVSRQALGLKIPVNVVDDPARSSFIVPSLVERGDLLVAISTSGQSPALAKILRQRLQREIGPEFSSLLKLLGAVRRKLRSCGFSQEQNQKIFRRLVRNDLLSLIRKRDWRGLDNRVQHILGPAFSLQDLDWKK